MDSFCPAQKAVSFIHGQVNTQRGYTAALRGSDWGKDMEKHRTICYKEKKCI